MRSMRALLSTIWRRPFPFEKRLLRLLASRYSFRLPTADAPAFASGEDARAPTGILNRSGMIQLAFEFLRGNLLQGDYFEFGCWGGRTFRMAFDHHGVHFENLMHFWLFDSFSGLPQLTEIDRHPTWKAGDYCTPLEDFLKIADSAGIPRERYTVCEGYYQETLTPELSARLAAQTRAGLVYIDCDLYESTRLVLNFIRPLLQSGTVVCFDDYYCFSGQADRGEQLALKQFLQKNQDVGMLDYVNYSWGGKSFIVQLR